MLSKNKKFNPIKIVALSFIMMGVLGVSQTALASKTTTILDINLMMLVSAYATQLELTDKQSKEFKTWMEEHGHAVGLLTQELAGAENELRDATLDGANLDYIHELRDLILKTRKKLMDDMYDCVTNMREKLSEKQWEQLMALLAKQEEMSDW